MAELFYSGLLDALIASDSNSIVFTFTDAEAKDTQLAGVCISLATKKRIKILMLMRV